jgi:hypothetical protein
MATRLEDCTTEELCSVVLFCVGKGRSSKDIHKEMFPVYGGTCLSRKADHNWVANVSLMTKRLKMEVRKWLRQQSKDFYAAGLDAVTSVISVGGGYVEKFFISLVLHFIFIRDLFTDLPRMHFTVHDYRESLKTRLFRRNRFCLDLILEHQHVSLR